MFRAILPFPALALAAALPALGASTLRIADANGNTLAGGFLGEADSAYTVILRTDSLTLDTLTAEAVTRVAGDTAALVLVDTADFRGALQFTGRFAFAVAAKAAGARAEASAFDTLTVRWTNPLDTSDHPSASVPVRPAARQARAWFSSKADGADTTLRYTGGPLHLIVADQVLAAGVQTRARVATRSGPAGGVADVESVELAAVAGRPGVLAATLPVDPSGSIAPGDGSLQIKAGHRIDARYQDPVDADSATAEAAFGPAGAVVGTLRFTGGNGDVLPAGTIYSPATGMLFLRHADDWLDTANPVKTARLVAANGGGSPPDTESVTMIRVEAKRRGDTAVWEGKIALRDFGARVSGDGTLRMAGQANLVARLAGHDDRGAPSDTLVDTLRAALPEAAITLSLEDARGPFIAVSGGSRSLILKAEGGNRTTAVDTVRFLLRCTQSGDVLAVAGVEVSAMSGSFLSAPIPLRTGPAAPDDTLGCLAKDVLRFAADDPAYASRPEDQVTLDASSARETSRLPRGPRIARGRLVAASPAGHSPVSVACFDALGVYVGRGRPVPGSGEWILPRSAGPLHVEIRWPDGPRHRLLAPPAP